MKLDISKYTPCTDSIPFLDSKKDYKQAWEDCERGDWMLWIAHNTKVDKKIITLAKGLCANTVIHLMKDKRSIHAVEVAIKYGRGLATDKELNDAADDAIDAYAAYAAYTASSSSYASYASASAAYASASYASYASASASSAAYASASASSAYADDGLKTNRQLTANICRKILTKSVLEKLKEIEIKNSL